jgi:hypothetical protein
MTATMPVDFGWSPSTTRCFLSLLALHHIHDWALLSSPWLGESSLVGINLQYTIVLLSWNKKRLTSMHTLMGLSHGAADNDADDDTDVNTDDDTAMQMMDDNVDNGAAHRQ